MGTGAPIANAQTFLKFSSEPGDYIGGGQTLIFTPADSDFRPMVSQDQRAIGVSISPHSGSFWSLDMVAPDGQKLVPGVYEGATRAPFQTPSTPGLSFSGDGRGCNELTGRFEVQEAVYGPLGYVERFHATFEQHCEGFSPALFGEIQIVNPPPPPPLTLNLKLDQKGKVQRVTGAATVGGTIQCSQAATVQLFGTITQRISRTVVATGTFNLSTQCSSTPTAWTARVVGFAAPFVPGPAQLEVGATATDPNYGVPVTTQSTILMRFEGGGKR